MGDRSDTPRWDHFFKRWHGSGTFTGTLSAWGVTGAFFPWRDPGEGEPEIVDSLVSRGASGFPQRWGCSSSGT
jgi:hypothetical protein